VSLKGNVACFPLFSVLDCLGFQNQSQRPCCGNSSNWRKVFHFLLSFHLTFSIRSGYSAGAIALGQSLVDVGSQLTRVVLVTPEVEDSNRQLMSKLWTVIEIQPIACNHKLDPSITSDQFDLQGEQYLAGSNLPLLLVVDIVFFRNSKVASHMQQIRGLDFDSIQACCLYG
jgi:hypothetical protein